MIFLEHLYTLAIWMHAWSWVSNCNIVFAKRQKQAPQMDPSCHPIKSAFRILPTIHNMVTVDVFIAEYLCNTISTLHILRKYDLIWIYRQSILRLKAYTLVLASLVSFT